MQNNPVIPANDAEFTGIPTDPKKRAEYFNHKYGKLTTELLGALREYFPSFPMNKGNSDSPASFKSFYFRTESDGIVTLVYGSCHISFPADINIQDGKKVDLTNYLVFANGKQTQLDSALKLAPNAQSRARRALARLLPNLDSGTPKINSAMIASFKSISIEKKSI